MADDIDYMAVASMTEGMVGAELANIIEIAAINMMRDGRSEVCNLLLTLCLNLYCSVPASFFSFCVGQFCGEKYFEHAIMPKLGIIVQDI